MNRLPKQNLANIACLPTREKYYSEDPNTPLERIGEWYLYTTDKAIPYYYNSRTKKTVWERPYRDILPSPQSDNPDDNHDNDNNKSSHSRMESIPYGNTPFPNMDDRDGGDDNESSSDDQDDTVDDKQNIDIDEYFSTNKVKQSLDGDKQDILQYDPEYNNNIPPASLSYPINELVLLISSKMDEIKPQLKSKNIGCCTFKIEPKLPEGIDFDTDNGIIYGYPMEVTKKQKYKITAINIHGSTNTNIYITVQSSNSNDSLSTTGPGVHNGPISFGFGSNNTTLVKETKELTFDTHEEALAAFYELLANKGVNARTKWLPIQMKLKRDPRYTALKTESERKIAFKKYRTELIFASGDEQLIINEKSRLKQIRIDFKNYLKEKLPLTRLDYIKNNYLINKPSFDDDDDDDNDNSDDIDDIDINVNNIKINELCRELENDERYQLLSDDPSERQSIIVDHIQILEYQKQIEIEEMIRKNKLEKKQNFMMLLHELSFTKDDPLFHAKTPFKVLCNDEVFVSDERFAVFINDDELRLATEYFDEYCLALSHELENDKQVLKHFFRKNRISIKYNDTVFSLCKYFGKSSALSNVNISHLRILFKEMIGKQQHLVKSGVISVDQNRRYHRHNNKGTYYNNGSRTYRDRDNNDKDKYSNDRYDRNKDRDRYTDRDKDRDRKRYRSPSQDHKYRKKDYTSKRSRSRSLSKRRDKSKNWHKSRSRSRRRDRSISKPKSKPTKSKTSVKNTDKASKSSTKAKPKPKPKPKPKLKPKPKDKEDGEIESDAPTDEHLQKRKKSNHKKSDDKKAKTKEKDKDKAKYKLTKYGSKYSSKSTSKASNSSTNNYKYNNKTSNRSKDNKDKHDKYSKSDKFNKQNKHNDRGDRKRSKSITPQKITKKDHNKNKNAKNVKNGVKSRSKTPQTKQRNDNHKNKNKNAVRTRSKSTSRNKKYDTNKKKNDYKVNDKSKYKDKDKHKDSYKEKDKYADNDKYRSNKDKNKYKDVSKENDGDKYSKKDKHRDNYTDRTSSQKKDKNQNKSNDKYRDKDRDKYKDKDYDKYKNKVKDKDNYPDKKSTKSKDQYRDIDKYKNDSNRYKDKQYSKKDNVSQTDKSQKNNNSRYSFKYNDNRLKRKRSSSKSPDRNKYSSSNNRDRWRGNDNNDDNDRWKPEKNKNKNKKRQRESYDYKDIQMPSYKKQKIYSNNNNYSNIDNNDRWQPHSDRKEYSPTSKYNSSSKYDRNRIVIDKDRFNTKRTSRERMLREKLLANINKKQR